MLDHSWIGLLGMLRLKRQLMIRGAANPLRIWKSFGEIRLREPKEFFVASFLSFLVAHRFALPASIRKAADCTSFSPTVSSCLFQILSLSRACCIAWLNLASAA